MASSRLFNNIGKKCHQASDQKVRVIFLFVGRIGLGVALAGGVINSMLYNGNKI